MAASVVSELNRKVNNTNSLTVYDSKINMPFDVEIFTYYVGSWKYYFFQTYCHLCYYAISTQFENIGKNWENHTILVSKYFVWNRMANMSFIESKMKSNVGNGKKINFFYKGLQSTDHYCF